jgi:hypothetical protein
VRKQTISSQIEVIVADNLSTDGSDRLAQEVIADLPNGRFIQNGRNLGFCEGNNRGAAVAKGEFLFFLNNDAWLERDTLEILYQKCKTYAAQAAGPRVLNYDDSSFQSGGAEGFDLFGLPSGRREIRSVRSLMMPEGCAYFVQRSAFEKVGKFDAELFMYADEYDLSWKLWLAGYKIISLPDAKVHHRGAANVNPAGGEKVIEVRTSDTKRYLTNRNCLLVLLKNCQHVLLTLVFIQILLLLVEALVSLVLVRRWSFIRRAYIEAFLDCFKMRGHVRQERKAIAKMRRRSDVWMLRFINLRLNRLDELKRMLQFGVPKVAPK